MNDQAPRLEPVAAVQRIDTLDVLRGFALLGILLVNFEYFSKPIQAIVLGLDPTLPGLDRMVAVATQVLMQGKFYSLFSMLFGMGFALMMARADERGGGFFGVYLRRVLILLAIGLAHALFIWSGDILVTYALFGLVMLLFFRRTPTSRLPKWAIGLMLVPVLLMWAFSWGIESMGADSEATEVFAEQEALQRAAIAEADSALRSGTFAAVTSVRLADFVFMMSSLPFFGIGILGYFLLGAWFLRSGIVGDPTAHRGFLRRLAAVGLVAGLLLSVLASQAMEGQNRMVPSYRLAAGVTMDTAGSLLLMLGYMSSIILLLGHGARGRILRVLAPAGRMALTNYLTQSLVWTLVFYGYGLGFYGEASRVAMLLMGIAFFALQVAFSHWWLHRFRFGPVEWLWRSLTYLKPQPMRRAADGAV